MSENLLFADLLEILRTKANENGWYLLPRALKRYQDTFPDWECCKQANNFPLTAAMIFGLTIELIDNMRSLVYQDKLPNKQFVKESEEYKLFIMEIAQKANISTEKLQTGLKNLF